MTLAEVVRRAVEACDDGSSEALDELLARFEDADVTVASIEDIEATLDMAIGPVDPDAEPADLLRLAARAEFGDDPPEAVARWLAQQGVTCSAPSRPHPSVAGYAPPVASAAPTRAPNVHP
ncbi:MAG TPA: hypothetical protein VIX82_16690, partial [Solirubrobacteraceae bacterium]